VEKIRDKDYLETVDNWMFCVVGEVHPPDGFFAYPKYVPGEGPWKRGNQSFKRIFKEYSIVEFKRILEELKKSRSEYVIYDHMINAEMFFTPRSKILRYYNCREGLRKLLEKDKKDRLEEVAVELVHILSQHSDTSLEDFGITGSILLGIHYEKSDIDIVVYGGENFWKISSLIEELGYIDLESISKKLHRYPHLMCGDPSKIINRIKYRGVYRGVRFSVNAIRSEEELHEEYGEYCYNRVGIAKAILEIVDSRESIFTPSIYTVRGSVEMGSEKLFVQKLICYDGMYTALFRPGEYVEVYGKLEEVREIKSGRKFYSFLIGSFDAAGIEYIKLLK